MDKNLERLSNIAKEKEMINMSTDLNPLKKEKKEAVRTYDLVKKPKHYNREGGLECIDEMLLIFGLEETLSFCKLNAWKYRYRAADKNGAEDLAKSDWYIAKYKELSELLEIADNFNQK